MIRVDTDIRKKTAWCNTEQKETLKLTLKEHYMKRTKILNSLNNLLKYNNHDGYDYLNLDFINNFYNYIRVNDNCLCNVTKESNPIKLIEFYGKGKVGSASKIMIYNNKKVEYILKTIENIPKPIKEYMSLRVKNIDYNLVKSHYKNSDSLKYNHMIMTPSINKPIFKGSLVVANPGFINQTCQHMILNEILGDSENYIYQYDAYICECNDASEFCSGYNIMEKANRQDLSTYLEKKQISGKLLLNILIQVLKPLAVLKCKKYGFVHADLKCRNVFVNENEINNIPTFKIADYDKSSIYWKGVRFYIKAPTQTVVLSEYYKKSLNINEEYYKDLYQSIATMEGYEIKEQNKIKYYTLEGNIPCSLFIMYSWVPMHMSYDIYTFMFSLLREPAVWNHINNINVNDENTQKFNNLWRNLWFKDDYIKVTDHLNNIHKAHAKLKFGEEGYDKSLANLRSLSKINDDLQYNLKSKLKYNINEIFDNLKINSPNKINKVITDFNKKTNKKQKKILLANTSILRGEYHVCTGPCDKLRSQGLWGKSLYCSTNKYSNINKTYDWDYCNLKKN